MGEIEIIDTNSDNILEYGVCGYKDLKRAGYSEKINWLKDRYNEGLKIKILKSKNDGTQGMIEYIPGEYGWRPVEAGGYMLIHCIFVGFKRAYKGQGYGSLMVDDCLREAEGDNRYGVVVVTRKGTWMAGKELFVKKGFDVVDTAPPDFELVVKRFDNNAPIPTFKGDWERKLSQYSQGLTILRADQCPAIEKSINDINKTAEEVYGLKPQIIDLTSCKDAQESPCAFGSFCIIFNGRLVAHNPISHTRFVNIMEKIAR